MPGIQRPLVNLLFSGGVFRGVYQIGVLNALSEVDLKPDVAGGIRRLDHGRDGGPRLSLPRGPDRERRIARLSATYLALNRLILTDRFLDLFRNFTLRAASTRSRCGRQTACSSLRPSPSRRLQLISPPRRRRARTTVPLSPFEAQRPSVEKAIRERRSHEVIHQLVNHVQEWLDRSGVNNEILGAEPLALLIGEHVIEGGAAGSSPPPDSAQVPFDHFLGRSGVCFLATATNLTEGRLQILGRDQLTANPPVQTLLDGLLASSAFPGVFRPREAWELMPITANADQFIDGGVIDNLPLDAVAEFLQRAASGGKIASRPLSGGASVPHLLFSASLETELTRPTPEQLVALQNNWPALFRRTGQLGYNRKLDIFSETQRDLRAIHEYSQSAPAPWTPLDLEVVMVRPKWLCGTFAFHPMLGFRRSKQTASIAHGCATTLVQLGALQQSERTSLGRAWGIRFEALPPAVAARRDRLLHRTTARTSVGSAR